MGLRLCGSINFLFSRCIVCLTAVSFVLGTELINKLRGQCLIRGITLTSAFHSERGACLGCNWDVQQQDNDTYCNALLIFVFFSNITYGNKSHLQGLTTQDNDINMNSIG